MILSCRTKGGRDVRSSLDEPVSRDSTPRDVTGRLNTFPIISGSGEAVSWRGESTCGAASVSARTGASESREPP